MKSHAIFHEVDSNYAFPTSTKTVVLRLRTAKNDHFDKVEVVYGMKYTFYHEQINLLMRLKYEDELFSYYEVTLDLSDPRLVYVFRLTLGSKTYYYSEDGITHNYDFKLSFYNCFQIAYINEVDIPKNVPWMNHSVFYQIFIDRFYRQDFLKNQSYINLTKDDVPKPDSFGGGDIKGIISKIDYLKNLGINALYLTPIFNSVSNHKYDIQDYYQVDWMFGTNEDLLELVRICHENNIKVVLDAVFNHVSELCMEFQDVVKYGRKSKYFDWFIIYGDEVDLEVGNYEYFGVCKYMPKWNTSNPEVQKYLCDIATHYIRKYDIDGWRLDVSDEVSHDFWRMFRKEVKKAKSDAVTIGENWHDAKSYLQGDQFDSILNYSFTKIMLDYFANKTINNQQLIYRLNNLYVKRNSIMNNMMLNLLDTHDTDRFYSEVKEDKNVLLQALSLLFMYSGTPCLYYGTEVPLIGGYDPDNRRMMDFEAVNDENEYFMILKSLISLRKNDVIIKGEISYDSDKNCFYLKREHQNKVIMLIINNSNKNIVLDYTNVIVSNNLNNNILKGRGFAIVEIDK